MRWEKKGEIHTLYECTEKEYQRLKRKIDSIQTQLKAMPKGEIQCVQDGRFQRWYLKEKGKKTYLSKKKKDAGRKVGG